MDESFDVCVVGSGASGAVVAKELWAQGYRVALVEKGDWVHRDANFTGNPSGAESWLAEDELLFKSWKPFQPRRAEDPTLFAETDNGPEKESSIGYSYELVGGGTRLYAGAAWRFRERDFKKYSHYGDEEGASVVDWPISYDDLEPYYTRAERELGISGDTSTDPTEPRRSGPLLPPIDPDAFTKKIRVAAQRLGWHPCAMPLGLVSQAGALQSGFPACKRSGWCSGYTCQFDGKSSVDARLLSQILDPTDPVRAYRGDHGFRLFHNTVAFRIETDINGVCSGVVCKNLNTDQWLFISARIVVLAASAIQTTRLMLLSDSGLFPDGLCNESGLLGKNLMFHIYGKQSGVFSESFPYRLNKLLAINDFHMPERYFLGFQNHCSIMSGSKWGPIKFARKWDRNPWGESFVRDMVERYSHTQLLQAAVEDLPQERNQVAIHPTRTDRYGMPAPKVIHRYHEKDREALRFTLEMCAVLLQESGGVVDKVYDAHQNIRENYTYHLMGTCRMGDFESSSVVNRYCRSHAIPNLFVVDGSVFPTSAALNPTLTIQANAYRVADYIITQTQQGIDWRKYRRRTTGAELRAQLSAQARPRRSQQSEPYAPEPLLSLQGEISRLRAERDWDFWMTLEAAADRFIPEVSQVAGIKVESASALGIVEFFRLGLEENPTATRPARGWLSPEVALFIRFVVELNKLAVVAYSKPFERLDTAPQDICMRNLERKYRKLFNKIRQRVMEGYFSDPRHGANAGYQAWNAIGLDSVILKDRKGFPEHSP